MAGNGLDYERMETEADRILYRRQKETEGDVIELRRAVYWIIGLLIANLGGVLFSAVQAALR